jgi:hypothetical protein
MGPLPDLVPFTCVSIEKLYSGVNPAGGKKDGARSQPPEPFKLAGFLVGVRAESVMQPLSGLKMVRAD